MSRRDPGAANGGPVREPGRCRCRHTEAIHALRNGHRTGCSASTCGCRQYWPVPACCICDPAKCAADDTGEHCNNQSCGVCLHGCPAPVGVPCCREATP